jgi:prevent-host-death family protein
MNVINMTAAKAHFSEIVHQAMAGEDVIIQLMGKPVVRIVRYESEKKTVPLGLLAGQATIPDDFDTWPSEEAMALGIIDPPDTTS